MTQPICWHSCSCCFYPPWLSLRGLYPPELRSTNLDAEWLYRKLLPAQFNRAFDRALQRTEALKTFLAILLVRLVAFVTSFHRPTGFLARTWPTGRIVSWVAVLLALYLLMGYFAALDNPVE